jgi:hypothetical protein
VSHRKKNRRSKNKFVTVVTITDFVIVLILVSRLVNLLSQTGVL